MRAETAALVGQEVGHIRLVEVLGEGGMGAVYAGFDRKLERRVAVKVIRSESRLNPEAKARFLREARILSQLAHPSICTVFDFVEGDDVDYLVLELVDGVSLREALREGRLDQRRTMAVAFRLLEVLIAVHARGVVHRDLKPENVMITADGGVKVLDFGLARSAEEEGPPSGAALDSGAAATAPSTHRSVHLQSRLGAVVGTVGYMSPEQARGEGATAASDMYSLGLVLQELFTGKPPFEEGLTAVELLLKAADGESRPAVGLAPDLEALVNRLKAAAPGSRPSSVDALAQLQRIADRPRRVRRRVMVAGVWAALLGLAAGMAVQSVRATREAARRQEEATAARQVSEFLVGIFEGSHPDAARGNTITAREVLDRGARKVERELAEQPLIQARLMRTMGRVYSALGLYPEAATLLRRAVDLCSQAEGEGSLDVARALYLLARVDRDRGRLDEADALYRRALDTVRSGYGPDHPELAAILDGLGSLADYQARHEDALELHGQSLAIRERHLGPDHPDLRDSLHGLADAWWRLGEFGRAEAYYLRAMEITQHHFGEQNSETALLLNNLANLYADQGRMVEAQALYERSIAIFQTVLGPDHWRLTHPLNNLGVLHLLEGRYEEAEECLVRALANFEAALGPDHPDLAAPLAKLARLHLEQGRLDRVEPLLDRAQGLVERHLGPDHPWVARVLETRAELLRATDRGAEAEVVEDRIRTLREAHPHHRIWKAP